MLTIDFDGKKGLWVLFAGYVDQPGHEGASTYTDVHLNARHGERLIIGIQCIYDLLIARLLR